MESDKEWQTRTMARIYEYVTMQDEAEARKKFIGILKVVADKRRAKQFGIKMQP